MNVRDVNPTDPHGSVQRILSTYCACMTGSYGNNKMVGVYYLII